MKKHSASRPALCPQRWRRWSRKKFGAFASLHHEVSIGVLSCSMSLVLLSTPTETFAQQFDTDSVKELDISEVVVTGNILPPTRTAVLPIPVLDRSEAATAPLQSIEAALRLCPSVDLRERGSKGVQADISVRGGSFDQTIVMLIGIDFSDARTGHQSHSLPIDLDIVSDITIEDGTAGIGAFSGDVDAAHRKGVQFLSSLAGISMRKADITITSNGGYPLDQNIYQAVKGMCTAEAFTKPRGVIIMASSCVDGHGGDAFYSTFSSGKKASDILKEIEARNMNETRKDQWQSQVFARILSRYTVILVSEADRSLVESMQMIPSFSIEDAVNKADEILGKKGTINVIANGIASIPS